MSGRKRHAIQMNGDQFQRFTIQTHGRVLTAGTMCMNDALNACCGGLQVEIQTYPVNHEGIGPVINQTHTGRRLSTHTKSPTDWTLSPDKASNR